VPSLQAADSQHNWLKLKWSSSEVIQLLVLAVMTYKARHVTLMNKHLTAQHTKATSGPSFQQPTNDMGA